MPPGSWVVPPGLSRLVCAAWVVSLGFPNISGQFDFVYVPADFKHCAGCVSAFVNFLTADRGVYCGGDSLSQRGIYDIITMVHMKTLKYNAIVGSIGVVGNEIAFPDSEGLKGMSAIVPASSMNVSHDVIGRFQADSQGVAPLVIISP